VRAPLVLTPQYFHTIFKQNVQTNTGTLYVPTLQVLNIVVSASIRRYRPGLDRQCADIRSTASGLEHQRAELSLQRGRTDVSAN